MLVRVSVTPDARREKCIFADNSFVMSVREPAEGNAANMRVRQLVALHYHIPVQRVRIKSGHHSPRKVLEVQET